MKESMEEKILAANHPCADFKSSSSNGLTFFLHNLTSAYLPLPSTSPTSRVSLLCNSTPVATLFAFIPKLHFLLAKRPRTAV